MTNKIPKPERGATPDKEVRNSLENILRNVDPCPGTDEETDRFVAAIYADRRRAALAELDGKPAA